MRYIRRNAIAIIALVFATTGTGIAASRYVITSSSQIKPSVLRELSANAHAAEVKLAASGAHAVRTRVRTVGSVTEQEGTVADPVTGATWKQGAEELNLLIGEVNVTPVDKGNSCGTEHTDNVEVLVDGTLAGTVPLTPLVTYTAQRETIPFELHVV